MVRQPKDIKFTIYGNAKGKAMPFVVKNKHTGKTHAIPPTKEWEETMAGQAMKYKPPRPMEGPIALGIVVYRVMPKYIREKKQKRDDALSRKLLPTSKPDVKNTTAAIEDAFKGIFWIDDSQVCQYIDVDGVPFGKYYGEVPKIDILIRPLPY